MAVHSLAPRPRGGAAGREGIVPGSVLGTKADLTVRLADGAADIDAAQHLRYRVFYEELEARPDDAAKAARRDADRYDAICDHLLVVRNGAASGPDEIQVGDGELVGTYRLLRQSVAERSGGFYTQDEFDIRPLIERHSGLKFLELGRSCVLKPYRTKPVVELLWQGIWNYVRLYDLDVMLGCASLEGTDPDHHALGLSFMAQNCAAPPEWQVSALPSRKVEMNLLPPSGVDAKRALRILPPLIKGYLRLGCYIGDGAVIDHQFNTIDVLIILPVSAINPRYFSYFGQPDEDPLAQS
ncbi:GNAT family N-acetyltransferase [Nordella sp. HKS 07]|nr:GNAT family N-acetyltransferase [Nordella sp. HKS 07]